MSQQQLLTIAVYSEAGGVTKTTTAVSLAMAFAVAGKRTVLVDLDPRRAASALTGVEPSQEWEDVSAILGNEDPDGYVEQLAIQTDPERWHELLRVVPSSRRTSVVEAQRADHQELRLARALTDVQADVVVIDCPNRQGGPLTLNALSAASMIVYSARPDEDGLEGVAGARHTVARFTADRKLQGVTAQLTEAGIVIGQPPTPWCRAWSGTPQRCSPRPTATWSCPPPCRTGPSCVNAGQLQSSTGVIRQASRYSMLIKR